jgi:hypothetical protein
LRLLSRSSLLTEQASRVRHNDWPGIKTWMVDLEASGSAYKSSSLFDGIIAVDSSRVRNDFREQGSSADACGWPPCACQVHSAA